MFFSDLRLKCSLAEYGKKNNNLLFICNDTLPVKMRFDPELSHTKDLNSFKQALSLRQVLRCI